MPVFLEIIHVDHGQSHTHTHSSTLHAAKLMKAVGLFFRRAGEEKRGVKDNLDRMEKKLVILITNQKCSVKGYESVANTVNSL